MGQLSKKQSGWILIVSCVVIVIAVALIIFEISQPKKVTPHPYSTQAVQNAVSSVESSKSANSYTNYNEADAAGDIYAAEGEQQKALAAYQRAEQLAGVPGAELFL